MFAYPIDAPAFLAFALRASPLLVLALALIAHIQERRRISLEKAAHMEAALHGLSEEVRRLRAEAPVGGDAESPAQFLATMSHELRTPLSGILGIVDVLSETPLNPEQRSYLEAIRGSGHSLTRLIDDILDLAKIDAGRAELASTPFDLRKLIEGVVELLAPRAQIKGLEIAASVAQSAPSLIVGDEHRLRQVLLNLAGNAVKFTARGGVGLSVERAEDGRVVFCVSDTGPGVPDARKAAIFEEFEQGPEVRPREGAGLGLAICKRLVAMMGGDITLSDNPAGGAIFRFALFFGEARDQGAPTGSAARLSGLDVCIVAHSPFEAPFIAARLAEAGARVRRADGVEDGVALLNSGQPHGLVIVDCALGESAMARLAAAAKTAGARQSLVLFSPFERRAMPGRSFDGFDGWLVKPVRASSLFDRLRLTDSSSAVVETRSLRRGGRALLAEDDDVNALVTERALRRLDFDVVRARDGAAALRVARSAIKGDIARFDVLVMDLRMPGLEGEEVSRAIRRLEREFGAAPTPILALSASAGEAQRRSGGLAGIDAFLEKPADFATLAAALEDVTTPRMRHLAGV